MSIVLAMIVRDESAVIKRCLDSVADLVDGYVIVDTGSKDETIDKIKAHDLSGDLHERPWTNFGENRTELMRLAKGSADWLLLLDADMTLRQDLGQGGLGLPPIPSEAGEGRGKDQPQVDAWLLRHAGGLEYYIPRLVSGKLDWFFTGKTHEYLELGQPFRSEKLPGWIVEHHADGGRRSEKFTRDERLLREELAEDPGNVRAMFYLANTLRDLGADRWPEAIEMYKQRADAGGWEEESFYARLMQGTLQAKLNFELGVPILMDAWEMRPSRAEPLYELAAHFRARKWFANAKLFAGKGLGIPMPPDVLFVHRIVYEEWLPKEYKYAMAEYDGPYRDED